jgi:hypothetical protein
MKSIETKISAKNESQKKFCKECGTKIDPGAKICQFCGVEL